MGERFTFQGEGAVLDNQTGLMWQRGGSEDRMVWKDGFCIYRGTQSERVCGFNDWRYPTKEEMAALILPEEDRHSGLYVNSAFGPQRNCWTSSEAGGHPRLLRRFLLRRCLPGGRQLCELLRQGGAWRIAGITAARRPCRWCSTSRKSRRTPEMSREPVPQRNTPLHLVEPLGFRITDRHLKRAGLDYWPHVALTVHPDLDALRRELSCCRWVCFSSRSRLSYYEFKFRPGDCLVFGPETTGLPADLLESMPERVLQIPLDRNRVRSLNLATTVGVALFEALRQLTVHGEVFRLFGKFLSGAGGCRPAAGEILPVASCPRRRCGVHR